MSDSNAMDAPARFPAREVCGAAEPAAWVGTTWRGLVGEADTVIIVLFETVDGVKHRLALRPTSARSLVDSVAERLDRIGWHDANG
jgi:hypothetical protein